MQENRDAHYSSYPMLSLFALRGFNTNQANPQTLPPNQPSAKEISPPSSRGMRLYL